jgi:hypothetical protein
LAVLLAPDLLPLDDCRVLVGRMIDEFAENLRAAAKTSGTEH